MTGGKGGNSLKYRGGRKTLRIERLDEHGGTIPSFLAKRRNHNSKRIGNREGTEKSSWEKELKGDLLRTFYILRRDNALRSRP